MKGDVISDHFLMLWIQKDFLDTVNFSTLVLNVLKPTISRDSFWNHSIKQRSDITSPFILNDDIICFIA